MSPLPGIAVGFAVICVSIMLSVATVNLSKYCAYRKYTYARGLRTTSSFHLSGPFFWRIMARFTLELHDKARQFDAQ